jgi:hypothetical protein
MCGHLPHQTRRRNKHSSCCTFYKCSRVALRHIDVPAVEEAHYQKMLPQGSLQVGAVGVPSKIGHVGCKRSASTSHAASVSATSVVMASTTTGHVPHTLVESTCIEWMLLWDGYILVGWDNKYRHRN